MKEEDRIILPSESVLEENRDSLKNLTDGFDEFLDYFEDKGREKTIKEQEVLEKRKLEDIKTSQSILNSLDEFLDYFEK